MTKSRNSSSRTSFHQLRHIILAEITYTKTVHPCFNSLFFEVPEKNSDPQYVGREWLYKKITVQLASTKGVVITGTPGSGKTTS